MSRDLLLLLWVAAAILLPGLVVSHRWLRLKGSESVAYGAAAGVVIQALLGLALVWTRQARWPVIGLSIALDGRCPVLPLAVRRRSRALE